MIDSIPYPVRWTVLAILCALVMIVAWKIVRDLYVLIVTKPKGERMWGDVAIVVSLLLAGMLLGGGLGIKDLPLGRALRDLMGW
jgi:hypothetical protein